MAGRYTRSMYDNCALQQDTKQSTDQLELIMDTTKFINCGNLCKTPNNTSLLVDVESGLWGLDKVASRCDSAKLPFCGPSGCLLSGDPRIAPHMPPFVCDWGHQGDKAVITTNMSLPSGPGFSVPTSGPCGANQGYSTK